ncbi:MAG: heme biosynthesis protein HemY [Azoarcus sp.]|jgi:HemY protein|nr:heme biosynthesis protein HemY [Azoarcus sp.]
MRVLIWVITIFAVAVGLVMLLDHDWGYAEFIIPHWYRAQMPLKLFVALLFIGFVAAYFLTRLVRNAVALPETVGQWRERRRRLRADRNLREALLSFHEGRYAQASKFAEKAYAASDHPAAAVLLAARSAHALHDEPRYRAWMERFPNEKSAQVARLMTEAELAIHSRDFEEAAARLETLRQDGHRHIAALRLSLRVASALQRWEDVLKLTRQLHKHKALPDEQGRPLLCRANLEKLREAIAVGDCKALTKAWESIPAQERDDRQFVAQALPLLARAGHGQLVRRTLERLLDDEWDSGLARLYAHCAEAGGACLAKAEEWLHDHKSDSGLLFALGRLCAGAGLWGKAESYYAASLGQKPEIETHLALARLFDSLERPADAQCHYRAAAEMAAA